MGGGGGGGGWGWWRVAGRVGVVVVGAVCGRWAECLFFEGGAPTGISARSLHAALPSGRVSVGRVGIKTKTGHSVHSGTGPKAKSGHTGNSVPGSAVARQNRVGLRRHARI